MLANHFLQNVLSAENFPKWKWPYKPIRHRLGRTRVRGRLLGFELGFIRLSKGRIGLEYGDD